MMRFLNRAIKYFLICFTFNASIALSEELILKDSNDIEVALEIAKSIDNLNYKVRSCINFSKGKVNACSCPDKESCMFKTEYTDTTNKYCALSKSRPEWANKIIRYQGESMKKELKLDMAGLNKHFQRYCEKNTQ